MNIYRHCQLLMFNVIFLFYPPNINIHKFNTTYLTVLSILLSSLMPICLEEEQHSLVDSLYYILFMIHYLLCSK